MSTRAVDGDRMRWLFDNYGIGWRGATAYPPDDDQLADFIEDLRHDFALEASASAAGAAPLDVALIGELVNALEWCDARYRQTLASKSVRDVDEMRAYVAATLTSARNRLSEGTDR